MAKEEIDDALKAELLRCRRVSLDGNRVIYNLEDGINFAEPKVFGKSFAAAFFESDVSDHIEMKDDSLEFVPEQKVEIMVPDYSKKESRKALLRFIEYLGDDEIRVHYTEEILKKASEVDIKKNRFHATPHSKYVYENQRRVHVMIDYLRKILYEVVSNINVVTNHDNLREEKTLENYCHR